MYAHCITVNDIGRIESGFVFFFFFFKWLLLLLRCECVDACVFRIRLDDLYKYNVIFDSTGIRFIFFFFCFEISISNPRAVYNTWIILFSSR